MAPQQEIETSAVLRCSTAMRTIGDGTTSIKEVASAIVGCLRDHFIDKDTGGSLLPLVRCYVTRPSSEIGLASQEVVGAAGTDAGVNLRAVSLMPLATAGENPSWNDRRAMSEGAVALPSVPELQHAPMIAQLVEQLGIEPSRLTEADPEFFGEIEERTYDVFFVPEALGSPYVPEQDDVVIPYGVRSVLGFGAVLPDGALLIVVLFSKVPIAPSTVDAFAAVALSTKLAVLPHVGGQLLADQLVKSQNMTLSKLLDLRDDISELAVILAEDRATALASSVARDVASSVARDVASSVARDVASSVALELASSVARDVARSEDQARRLASSVARDVASSEDEARELASSVARDIASTADVARHLASSVARDVASSEDEARELASSVARDVASTADVARELARSVARDIESSEDQARALAISRAALALSEAHKAAILEGALDCVIGMDSHGRITDFNRAAEVTFGCDRQEVVGEELADALIPYAMREQHRLGLAKLLATGEGPILGRRIEVNALRCDGTEFPAELTVTRVEDTDPPLFNAYVRDITSAQQAVAELAASRERLVHIAQTLQTSLLPPVLPEIAGIDLAATFRAFGDGYEVGGDFYDVFELVDGKWALTLGDVCGKGSEAAVVTALARYTLRAAAMRHRDPADVLDTLNEAIRRQHPDKLCTAVYATLDPGSGIVELALGGHPHPLLLTSAGVLSTVGTTSPLLGAFGNWKGSTDTVILGPGDLLFLYSDGVTEARAGEDFFGDDRLATALTAAKGLSATAAVKIVETAVLNFAGELNDDLAILAVRNFDISV